MRYKCASELHYNEVFTITNSAKENKILIIDWPNFSFVIPTDRMINGNYAK